MTGPERRRQRSEERLREALGRLIAEAGQGTEPGGRDALTVAALSRASGIGRNALCPCGSGKKYKRCHGAPGGATGRAVIG